MYSWVVRIHKDFQKAERLAKRQGWSVTLTKGNHLKWTTPDGRVIMTSYTPGDVRVIPAHLNRLRKAGLLGI